MQQPYKNLSGRSPVVSFQTSSDHLDITWKGGAAYRYGAAQIGRQALDQMIARAQAGRGLATFVTQNRTVYEAGHKI